MAFNPEAHMSKVSGRDYLEVKFRIAWFRDENPNGRIYTDIEIHGEFAIVKASIWNDDGAPIASGMATIRQAQGHEQRTWGGREVEKAETAAIGRALAVAGYGTQFTGDEWDEGDNLADSPVERKQQRQQAGDPPPSNITPMPLADGEKEGKSTITVRTKENEKGDKRYMVVSGVTIWTRRLFEALGFNQNIIDDLKNIGEHVLSDSVTPIYVMNGKYKELVRLRRDSTKVEVDAEANIVATPKAS